MADLTVPVLSVPSAPNFHSLALFVCHLFIDGNFRNGHILYDPKVYDGHLKIQIDSICPNQIPWHRTDITEANLSPKNFSASTDDILQLIFLDPQHSKENIDKVKDASTYYRIFVFVSNEDEIDSVKESLRVTKRHLMTDSHALILHYDSKDEDIHVGWILENHDGKDKTTDSDMTAIALPSQPNNDNHMNSFDRTFGQYERMQSIIVGAPVYLNRVDGYIFLYRIMYMTNYFAAVLHSPVIKLTILLLSDGSFIEHRTVTQNKMRFYNELGTYYDLEHIEQT